MNSVTIGVFDSGVGGLSILRELMNRLSSGEIIYFGDTARFPYGEKTTEEIYHYSKQICNFFIKEYNTKVIIIACNTATIASIERLKKEFAIPIIGIPDFGVLSGNEITKNRKIGVLATKSTVKSGYYKNKLRALDSRNEVYEKACSQLVIDVENGNFDGAEVIQHIKEDTKELLDYGIDTLILGCTHFPFLLKSLQEVIPNRVIIVDPAYKTAEYIGEYLEENKLLDVNDKRKTVELCSSALNNETMISLAKTIFNEDKKVTTIEIDKY